LRAPVFAAGVPIIFRLVAEYLVGESNLSLMWTPCPEGLVNRRDIAGKGVLVLLRQIFQQA
jgi:hypothetical protein